MIYRFIIVIGVVWYVSHALPLPKANDALIKEVTKAAKETKESKIVKRSEESVIVGNHQNKAREKKSDPAVETKEENNRDENARIEVKAEDIDPSKINEKAKEDENEILQEAVEKQAEVGQSSPEEEDEVEEDRKVIEVEDDEDGDDDDDDDSISEADREKIKIVEEEKELEKLPKDGPIVFGHETPGEREDDGRIYEPESQDSYDVIDSQEVIDENNAKEVEDDHVSKEMMSADEEELEAEDEVMNGPNSPLLQGYGSSRYEPYDFLNRETYYEYPIPYPWRQSKTRNTEGLDRTKREAAMLGLDRTKREAAMLGSEASMPMASKDTRSPRAKRDTNYPLTLNDLYELYYKYKLLENEERENEVEPIYEVPDYDESESEEDDYDVALPQEWEPDDLSNEIRKELEYEALTRPDEEPEAPYPYIIEEPGDELEDDESGEVYPLEVPSESVYFPEEYEPVSAPVDEDEPNLVDKRREMLSMMPGIKRGEDFYPYYTEDQEPWQALIPPAAQKRGVMEEYARLYSLANALKRSREDALESRWESLLGGYYDEKKKK